MHPNPTLLARRVRDQQQDVLALATRHRLAAQAADANGGTRRLPAAVMVVWAAVLPLLRRVTDTCQRAGSVLPSPFSPATA